MQRADYRGFNDALLSLRGVAAFLVLIFHANYAFKIDGVDPGNFSGDWAATARQWILNVTNGQAAVIFFFVHSGFVLTLAFSRSGVEAPGANIAGIVVGYYVKRVFRLWPMIIVSCLLMFAAQQSGYGAATGAAFSDWFKSHLTEPTGYYNFKHNILLQEFNLNPFLWSLGIEVWGSILLPVFYFLGRRTFTTYLLLLAFYALIAGWPATGQVNFGRWNLNPLKMQFVFCITIGTILAFSSDSLSKFFSRTPRNAAVAIAIVVLLGARTVIPNMSICLVVECLASSVIIFVVYYFEEGPVQRFCNLPVVKFYGQISYSFYVNSLISIHVVGLMLAYLFGQDFLFQHGFLGGILISIGAVAVNTPLSWLTYSAVERPLMKLGRQLGGLIARIGPKRQLAPE